MGSLGAIHLQGPFWVCDIDPLESLKAEVEFSIRSLSLAHKISCLAHLIDIALSIDRPYNSIACCATYIYIP